MGRYTELARRLRAENPQEEGLVTSSNTTNVNIDSIYSNRDSSIDKPTPAGPKDTLEGFPPVDSSQSRTSGGKAVLGMASVANANVRSANLANLVGDEAGEVEERWILVPPEEHRYTKLARELRARAEKAQAKCIHELALEKCAVCNGYARWLIAGGAARIEEARSCPEGTRRLYWQLIEGGKV